MLAGFLREIGAEVKAASDGPSALEEVRSGFPDVALCDFRMPGMNGRELLREIKAVNPEVEVVVDRKQAATSLPALVAEEGLRGPTSIVVAQRIERERSSRRWDVSELRPGPDGELRFQSRHEEH